VWRTHESTDPQLLVVAAAVVGVAGEDLIHRRAAEDQALTIVAIAVEEVEMVVRRTAIVQWRALERVGRLSSVRFM
jgi:hypothetical protein